MKGLLAIAALTVSGLSALAEDPPPSARLQAGRHALTIEVAGWTRRFSVHVPGGYDPAVPAPLVLVFHGAGGSGTAYLDTNGWARLAERERFVVVAPDGLPATPRREPNFLSNPQIWNSGQLRPLSLRARIDDVAFVRALLDDLQRRLNLDPDRIYATGHSNGAGLTFLLGAQLSDRLAALAPVASHCWQANPRPAHPRPTLYLVGTQDPIVPIDGGKVALPWDTDTERPPLRQTFERWSKALGCAPTPTLVREDDAVRVERYAPGPSGADLTVYWIKGQGHGWPGGEASGLPARWIGPSVTTVDATETIWRFFQAHPRAAAQAPAPDQGAPARSTP